MHAEPDAWRRLAEIIRDRRAELGVVATAIPGVSAATMSLVENAGRHSYRTHTMAALARGLGWTPDSIERILDGQAPVAVDSPPETRNELGPVTRAEFDLLQRRFAALTAQLAARGLVDVDELAAGRDDDLAAELATKQSAANQAQERAEERDRAEEHEAASARRPPRTA